MLLIAKLNIFDTKNKNVETHTVSEREWGKRVQVMYVYLLLLKHEYKSLNEVKKWK